MEVDRPGADGAAARQGDDGLAETGDQRAEDEDGRPHDLDQVVGGLLPAEFFDPDVEGVFAEVAFPRRARP